MHDLAIIVVSHDGAAWVRSLLPTVFANLGEIEADVIVVDNHRRHETAMMVEQEFPAVRVLRTENHGFGHANNCALRTCDARYVLFLNPDVEIISGSFADLVRLLEERPSVGLVGCRQVTQSGALTVTGRYFPNAVRALGDAVAAERLGARRPNWLGERELDGARYDREFECDWTTGSFMLARREALQSAGWFDERFFMYSEEIDLCRRIKSAGWSIRHLPQMTILHHSDKDGIEPHVESLSAATRMMYARKHFSPAHRGLFWGALTLRHVSRLAYAGSGDAARARRRASREVTATLVGRRPVPFAELTNGVAREITPGDVTPRPHEQPASAARPVSLHRAPARAVSFD